MRLFCGVALVALSLVIYLDLAWVPLCVRHHERMAMCLDEESCLVFIVDYFDPRCTRALTLWAMDRPDPMRERWRDQAGVAMANVMSWKRKMDPPFQVWEMECEHNLRFDGLLTLGSLYVDVKKLQANPGSLPFSTANDYQEFCNVTRSTTIY